MLQFVLVLAALVGSVAAFGENGRLTISPNAVQTDAGTAIMVTVNALDDQGKEAQWFAGSVQLTYVSTYGEGAHPNGGKQETKQVTMNLKLGSAIELLQSSGARVSQITLSKLTTTTAGVDVSSWNTAVTQTLTWSAGPAASLKVGTVTPGSVTSTLTSVAGAATTRVATAYDKYENIAVGESGTIKVASSLPGKDAVSMTAPFVQGRAVVTLTQTKIGLYSVVVESIQHGFKKGVAVTVVPGMEPWHCVVHSAPMCAESFFLLGEAHGGVRQA